MEKLEVTHEEDKNDELPFHITQTTVSTDKFGQQFQKDCNPAHVHSLDKDCKQPRQGNPESVDKRCGEVNGRDLGQEVETTGIQLSTAQEPNCSSDEVPDCPIEDYTNLTTFKVEFKIPAQGLDETCDTGGSH